MTTLDKYGWQPIESAPKDGTRILAFQESSQGHGIVSWANSPGDGVWLIDAYGAGWMYPTHWMPLPDGKAGDVIRELVDTITNIQYHGELFMDVSDCKDFTQEERLMRLGNLLQSISDSEQTLANVEQIIGGEG